jgi:hypothetical protein
MKCLNLSLEKGVKRPTGIGNSDIFKPDKHVGEAQDESMSKRFGYSI